MRKFIYQIYKQVLWLMAKAKRVKCVIQFTYELAAAAAAVWGIRKFMRHASE